MNWILILMLEMDTGTIPPKVEVITPKAMFYTLDVCHNAGKQWSANTLSYNRKGKYKFSYQCIPTRRK